MLRREHDFHTLCSSVPRDPSKAVVRVCARPKSLQKPPLAAPLAMGLASAARGTKGVRGAVLEVDRAVGLQSQLLPKIGAAAGI